MTNGYLYCAYSQDGTPNEYFTEQFLVSYHSLKKAIPDSSVALYTNIRFQNTYGINHVIYDADIDRRHIAKAHGLLRTPYDKTIFLDTDTVIHRKCLVDVFHVLNEFEITACYGNSQPGNGSIYPPINTGLLGVRTSNFTKTLMRVWIAKFLGPSDQIPFREHIFMRHKKSFYILPTYFMYRWEHYESYPQQAVLSHAHSMSKKAVTEKIIKSYQDTL